jgi:hypothetical protein
MNPIPQTFAPNPSNGASMPHASQTTSAQRPLLRLGSFIPASENPNSKRFKPWQGQMGKMTLVPDQSLSKRSASKPSSSKPSFKPNHDPLNPPITKRIQKPWHDKISKWTLAKKKKCNPQKPNNQDAENNLTTPAVIPSNSPAPAQQAQRTLTSQTGGEMLESNVKFERTALLTYIFNSIYNNPQDLGLLAQFFEEKNEIEISVAVRNCIMKTNPEYLQQLNSDSRKT